MNTKVIALDIYGTILSTNDPENQMPVRKGFEEFVKNSLEKNIYLVSASDSPLDLLKIDLNETFSNSKLSLNIFDSFYRLQYYPKDFREIIYDYQISPRELFVIGDNFQRDLAGAVDLGCNTLLVGEYNSINDNFDFAQIIIP